MTEEERLRAARESVSSRTFREIDHTHNTISRRLTDSLALSSKVAQMWPDTDAGRQAKAKAERLMAEMAAEDERFERAITHDSADLYWNPRSEDS